MDKVSARWAMLQPHVQVVGPDDDLPRPTVLLLHGCGGLRSHLPRYAEAAKAAGWRAAIIDSYGPRGWDRAMTLATVCTGLLFRGYERAGDVLAAIHGLSQRPDVDASHLALAGWSHGGWAIMETMSETPEPGRMGVADPDTVDVSRVKGVWLAYAYIGPWAFNRMKPWRYQPRVFAMTARRDHLTTVRNAERVNAMMRDCGIEVESWVADGTHAFDEPSSNGPMRHAPDTTEEALQRFSTWLKSIAPTS